ncbi:AAA family ATPase [Enterococcus cecorum]|uniref:AAA family ATPase n=1 Tax=Enterococcus cecorum TaxID=44008 RepID=UPI00148B9DBC|nr:AAA family ATPase [Enterococcus cecorum]
MSIKISKLEIENVKRVKAVAIEPTQNGLTIIGGNNNQGKTSVLDAITWALGGNKYKPSKAEREGSYASPEIRIELSNGLIVERKGKNSNLKVTDPSGNKAGQQLLDEFVEELAINLPKFMEATNKQKAETLLQIIGVGEQLAKLEMDLTKAYNTRLEIGRIAEQKKKYADELPYFEDAPKELVSISDLIKQQQEILAINGENQRKRQQVEQLNYQSDNLAKQIQQLQAQLENLQTQHIKILDDLAIARSDAQDLTDQSTAEIEQSIANIEQINNKVRTNLDKERAESEAEQYKAQYNQLDAEVESIRQQKMDLLKGANLPLEGLSVEDGELTYQGQKWDNMSGSQQLKVATAIVRKLKPDCGFVLIDKLEQMDLDTLNAFGEWLTQEGLQAIATRVSKGGECSIIIEDGTVLSEEAAQPQPQFKQWKKGEF